MKKSLATLVLIILSACGGCNTSTDAYRNAVPPPPPPPPPPVPTAVELFTESIQGLTLTNFYDVSFGGLINRTPEKLVALSLDEIYPPAAATLEGWFPDYKSDTWTMHQLALDMLDTYDRSTLNAEGQLEYDMYEWYLQDVLAEQPFNLYSFPATYSSYGEPRSLQRFFEELHPMETEEDVQDYLDRLSVFDNKFFEIEIHIVAQSNAGIIEPGLTMDVAIDQLSTFASYAAVENPIFQVFRDKLEAVPGLSDGQRDSFRAQGLASISNEVIPAYQAMINRLQRLRPNAPAQIGVGQFPNGQAYYDFLLRHHTTTNLTAAEIHQLGLDELARIHAEMRLIFDQLGYPPYLSDDPVNGETLQELYARVLTDGGVVQAADSFATFENLVAFAESNLSQAFDVFPVADVVVLPDPSGGFYISPSFDGSRPGAFYAGTDFDQDYATMPTLTYHESLPGHHMQIAIQMESDIATFRKVVRSTAFTEGWGLYAERLAYELGWYDNGANGDVYGNLGRLQFEAMRAARLAMDTGIHSMGWTFEQATQFSDDNVGLPTVASQNAAGRYSVIPGQATAYMIGMLQILSERQRAMDALGVEFDLIDFHRALLTNGAVPLALLTDVVDRYIADAQAAP
jgi:uncharacterized protein (DUF885 family)